MADWMLTDEQLGLYHINLGGTGPKYNNRQIALAQARKLVAYLDTANDTRELDRMLQSVKQEIEER